MCKNLKSFDYHQGLILLVSTMPRDNVVPIILFLCLQVATMFAVMRETDYVQKKTFLSNFWNDWKKILGPGHVIQRLDRCDFTPIYEWHLAEKEKKKQMSSEVRESFSHDVVIEMFLWFVSVTKRVDN
mgnify:FL=1